MTRHPKCTKIRNYYLNLLGYNSYQRNVKGVSIIITYQITSRCLYYLNKDRQSCLQNNSVKIRLIYFIITYDVDMTYAQTRLLNSSPNTHTTLILYSFQPSWSDNNMTNKIPKYEYNPVVIEESSLGLIGRVGRIPVFDLLFCSCQKIAQKNIFAIGLLGFLDGLQTIIGQMQGELALLGIWFTVSNNN